MSTCGTERQVIESVYCRQCGETFLGGSSKLTMSRSPYRHGAFVFKLLLDASASSRASSSFSLSRQLFASSNLIKKPKE